MKYFKTTEGEYLRVDSVNVFSVRNKKLYAFTNDRTFILKQFDSDDDAQAYLDVLIEKLEAEE